MDCKATFLKEDFDQRVIDNFWLAIPENEFKPNTVYIAIAIYFNNGEATSYIVGWEKSNELKLSSENRWKTPHYCKQYKDLNPMPPFRWVKTKLEL